MPWIGVDLDETLAYYTTWEGPDKIGEPIPKMLLRVKQWLSFGYDVRIFTARVSLPAEEQIARKAIEEWCEKHIGQVLPITCKKDLSMLELWDNRVVYVQSNTGIVCEHVKSLIDTIE
jgi:hypothetical protein